MRDALIALLLLAPVPIALFRPWIGVLAYTVVSIGSPHKLAWGFAFDFPFAQILVIATLVGIVLSREYRKIPLAPTTVTILLFIAWMCVTSVFAIYPDEIGDQFSKVMKVQFMVFVTLMLLVSRQRIESLLYVIAASVAFWGIKGGLFVLQTGGDHRVFGPAGGFFPENNSLAVVVVMTIPLLVYAYKQAASKWLKRALGLSMFLCAAAVFGSQSRGALLAISAMAALLVVRSERRAPLLLVVGVVGAGLVMFMPEGWFNRMETIGTYQEDGSAMGRITAWWMAWNLASDRFLGGGFHVITQELFDRYAKDPGTPAQGAHSIYFQALGEHGFIGLVLFVLIWVFVWASANWLRKQTRGRADLRWAGQMAAMIQVSLVGFLVGGAFLNLTYFDMPYLLGMMVVAARCLVERELRAERTAVEGSTQVNQLVHG